ncbi:hypothetical protein B5F78_01845 [Bacteroides sp. An279]|nr:hypothetical protein B5F78_01845 [Bacteroides sp. An279]
MRGIADYFFTFMFTSRFSGVSDRNIMNSKKSFVIGNEVKYPGNVHVYVHEIFHNLSLDGKTSEFFGKSIWYY